MHLLKFCFVYEKKHDSILLGTTGTQHIAKTWFNGFYMHSGSTASNALLFCNLYGDASFTSHRFQLLVAWKMVVVRIKKHRRWSNFSHMRLQWFILMHVAVHNSSYARSFEDMKHILLIKNFSSNGLSFLVVHQWLYIKCWCIKTYYIYFYLTLQIRIHWNIGPDLLFASMHL